MGIDILVPDCLLGLGNFYPKGRNMMPQIDIGARFANHKFKLCTKCDISKPPEGGIEMGIKWICQQCWNKRITGKYLRQNQAKNA
jgi:hypothetical protein